MKYQALPYVSLINMQQDLYMSSVAIFFGGAFDCL